MTTGRYYGPGNVARHLLGLGSVGRIGSVGNLGTVSRITYVNRIGTMSFLGTVQYEVRTGTLGRMVYGNRIGSIGHLGSQPYLGTVNRIGGGRIGSVGRVGSQPYLGTVNRIGGGRIGSVGNLGSQKYLGTVNRIGGGRVGTVGRLDTLGTLGRARFMSTYQWSNTGGYKGTIRGSPGVTFIGSWIDISRYYNKTISVKQTSGGSLFVVTGHVGTTFPRMTGTYSSRRIGVGSYVQVSFTENFTHVRALFRHSGATAGGGGVVQGTAWIGITAQP